MKMLTELTNRKLRNNEFTCCFNKIKLIKLERIVLVDLETKFSKKCDLEYSCQAYAFCCIL